MNSIGGHKVVPEVWSSGRPEPTYTHRWLKGEELSLDAEADVQNFLLARVSEQAWCERWSVPYDQDGVDAVIAALRAPGCHMLLTLDVQGACIGLLDMHIDDSGSAEMGLIVADKSQRQGHGLRMVEEAERFARTHGLRELAIHAKGSGIEMGARKRLYERDPNVDGRYVLSLEEIEWAQGSLEPSFCPCTIY